MNKTFYTMPLDLFIKEHNAIYSERKVGIITTSFRRREDQFLDSQECLYLVLKDNLEVIEENMILANAMCSKDFYDITDANYEAVDYFIKGYALCLLGTKEEIMIGDRTHFDFAIAEFFNAGFLDETTNILSNYLEHDDYKSHFYRNSGVKKLIGDLFQEKARRLIAEKSFSK